MAEVIERDATAPVVKSDTPQPRAPKLLDQVRERICVLHYSRSTEKTYLYWIKFFILFHGKRHPRDMGAAEVEAFLSHLATQRDVAAGTQNQAMHAVAHHLACDYDSLVADKDAAGIGVLSGAARSRTAFALRLFCRLGVPYGWPGGRGRKARRCSIGTPTPVSVAHPIGVGLAVQNRNWSTP